MNYKKARAWQDILLFGGAFVAGVGVWGFDSVHHDVDHHNDGDGVGDDAGEVRADVVLQSQCAR